MDSQNQYVCITKNQKYRYNRSFLSNINSVEKAYLLGWINNINKKNWFIKIRSYNTSVEILRDIICKDIPINIDKGYNYFNICSKEICDDICKIFGINVNDDNNNNNIMQYPKLDNNELYWSFIRGFFEKNGVITKYNEYNKYNTCTCIIKSPSQNILINIGNFSNIPHTIENNILIFNGTNCIDFLGKLYNNCGKYKSQEFYNIYSDWLMCKTNSILPECFIYKTDKDAIIPFKTNVSDVGYDLSVIKEEKKWLNNITLYDTGIRLKVKHGLYAEVVPRSSLSKSGYMLANSTGIIDPSYNGNIFIALIKCDPSAEDIKLPFRCCQLIFRKHIHVDIIRVDEDFIKTERNIGGFGSTS